MCVSCGVCACAAWSLVYILTTIYLFIIIVIVVVVVVYHVCLDLVSYFIILLLLLLIVYTPKQIKDQDFMCISLLWYYKLLSLCYFYIRICFIKESVCIYFCFYNAADLFCFSSQININKCLKKQTVANVSKRPNEAATCLRCDLLLKCAMYCV